MSNPRELPQFASPAGVLGRLTVAAAAWFCAGAVVATALPTVLTPLPLERLMPPAPVVVARTPPASPEVRP
jgi:hypothetical protein